MSEPLVVHGPRRDVLIFKSMGPPRRSHGIEISTSRLGPFFTSVSHMISLKAGQRKKLSSSAARRIVQLRPMGSSPHRLRRGTRPGPARRLRPLATTVVLAAPRAPAPTHRPRARAAATADRASPTRPGKGSPYPTAQRTIAAPPLAADDVVDPRRERHAAPGSPRGGPRSAGPCPRAARSVRAARRGAGVLVRRGPWTRLRRPPSPQLQSAVSARRGRVRRRPGCCCCCCCCCASWRARAARGGGSTVCYCGPPRPPRATAARPAC